MTGTEVVIVLLFWALWIWAGVHMARSRGRDPTTWGIICFLTGVFGVIALAIAGDSREAREAEREWRQPRSVDYTEQLRRLSVLHDDGALSDTEYDQEKRKVLASH